MNALLAWLSLGVLGLAWLVAFVVAIVLQVRKDRGQ